MTDSFFDLGKELPKLSYVELRAQLNDNTEIFEHAYIPSSPFESDVPGDTISIKDKVFKRMRFYETRFVRIAFNRCTFDECLFLGAHFEDCEFHRCTFKKCNTNKFRLTRTYIDPISFVDNIFDKRKYANVGVNLFQTLLKNATEESQPEFRDTAEYHFRLWQRYNRVSYWKRAGGVERWIDIKFYSYWIWSICYQVVFGFGVRARNIVLWTPLIFIAVWVYNYAYWEKFGVGLDKLPGVSLFVRSAFFTVGNLSTFGTAELTPTTSVGLGAVSIQVIIGITWIALSTAMIVKRFIR